MTASVRDALPASRPPGRLFFVCQVFIDGLDAENKGANSTAGWKSFIHLTFAVQMRLPQGG